LANVPSPQMNGGIVNTTQSALAALTQLLVFALVIERIVQVGQLITNAAPSTPPNDEPTWGWLETCIALALSWGLLWLIQYDFLAQLFGVESSGACGEKPSDAAAASAASAAGKVVTKCITRHDELIDYYPVVGYLVGAVVAAGGSSGIRKIMDAISAAAKAATAESKNRFRRAEIEKATLRYSSINNTRTKPPEAANRNAQRVIDYCELEWPANSSDCSGFARDVAGDLGVPLTGNADAIVAQMSGSGWKPITAQGNKSAGECAKEAADRGVFVLGGLDSKSTAPRDDQPVTHGHVVVVVSDLQSTSIYPTAYWGTLGGEGKKFSTINWAWRKIDRDNVKYAYHEF
jgi:hypothetical protein